MLISGLDYTSDDENGFITPALGETKSIKNILRDRRSLINIKILEDEILSEMRLEDLRETEENSFHDKSWSNYNSKTAVPTIVIKS